MSKLAIRVSDSACGDPSTVEVLREKEMSSFYQCADYLNSCTSTNSSSSNNQTQRVTAATRCEMLEWVCKVTDFLSLTASGDDIAVLTATLLDRFLQTAQGANVLASIPDFRCATMACFYIVAKVRADHSYVVSAHVMSTMSRGQFSVQQVEDMEMLILTSMKWHINPPTALTFVNEFLGLLPCSVSASMRQRTHELCKAQIRRAMMDYHVFALVEASSLAFAALRNALRDVGMDHIILNHVCAIFCYATHTNYNSHCHAKQIQAVLCGKNDLIVPSPSLSHKANRHSNNTSKSTTTSNSSNSSSSSILKSSVTTERHVSHRHECRRTSSSLPFYGDSSSLSPCGVALEATAAK